MKERPIIFSGPMVRALLDGRKTQTRRVVKPQPVEQKDSRGEPVWVWRHNDADCPRWADQGMRWERFGCPYGIPGDRLWLRETWQALINPITPRSGWCRPERSDHITYRADGEMMASDFAWRSPRFMPRWASRITLELTAVRVERLQDISLDDCEAEGVVFPESCRSIANFALLWDSLNAKRAPWASNPWVWVLEFKRVTT